MFILLFTNIHRYQSRIISFSVLLTHVVILRRLASQPLCTLPPPTTHIRMRTRGKLARGGDRTASVFSLLVPYYRTKVQISVKIRRNSYGWQHCDKRSGFQVSEWYNRVNCIRVCQLIIRLLIFVCANSRGVGYARQISSAYICRTKCTSGLRLVLQS